MTPCYLRIGQLFEPLQVPDVTYKRPSPTDSNIAKLLDHNTR